MAGEIKGFAHLIAPSPAAAVTLVAAITHLTMHGSRLVDCKNADLTAMECFVCSRR